MATSTSDIIQTYEGNHAIYACSQCSATVALQDELISKAFSGRDGRGLHVFGLFQFIYSLEDSLMHSAINVRLGNKEDRPLLTGVHTVSDVFCVGCDDRIGWFYHKASDQSQKYKEGKYLLEREKLIKDNGWNTDEFT